MCGICGVIQIGGEARQVVSDEVIDRMTDALAHRGPYDRGIHTNAGVAIGARRLPLVDIERGHQPFANEDGSVWAALNGMIYNHDDLRADLQGDGHQFRSVCDTEVLPHLYERVGIPFAEKLRGEFAIVVWDEKRRRAVLARDRVGMKPLYVAQRDDLLIFASELKSLLASGLIEPVLDFEAIDAYLTFGFVPGPRTGLVGVEKLPAGQRMIVDPSGVRTEAYWSYPEPPSQPTALDDEEFAARLLAEVEESVRLRMIADVPVGAMLSGGIDSSVIVALMARNSSEPVKTFSIGFVEAERGANELADARLVANHFGTDHHEIELSFRDTVDLEELAWHLDEPLEDLSALGLLELSKFASRDITAALSGMGPDEILAGYKKHQAASLSASWDRFPESVKAVGARLAPITPRKARRAALTLTAPDPASRLVAMSGKLDPGLRVKLVKGPLAELDGRAAQRAVAARLQGVQSDALATTLYLDGQLDMVDHMLPYIDRASMARSLDLRAPFLDHRVVEFCASIPSRVKMRRLETKRVLKLAAAGLIPAEVFAKKKMGFFRGSMDGWLRAQTSGAISDYLLGPAPRYADFLDREEVERLVVGHASGRDASHGHLILSILMLEIWLSAVLPRATASYVAPRESIRIQT